MALAATAFGSVFLDRDRPRAEASAVRAEVPIRERSFAGSPTPTEPLDHPLEAPRSEPTSGRVRVRERVSIRGRVVTDAGEPIADAVVHAAAGVEEITSATGDFRFHGLREGVYWLHASAPGFAPRPAPPVRLSPTSVEDVELVLEPACTIRGRVWSEQGVTLGGARIEARLRAVDALPGAALEGDSSARRQHTICDESGRFCLGPWPAGDVELIVTHDRHDGWGRVVRSDRADVAIALQGSPGAIAWIVGVPAPRPVAVAMLVSLAEAQGPWRLLEPHCAIGDLDGSGRFPIDVASRRWVRLFAQGPKFGAALSEPFRIDRNVRRASVPLTVLAAASMTGRVQDPDGRPLADAELVVRRTSDRGLPLQPGALLELARVRTASDGSFSTLPVPSGWYQIDASHLGSLSRTLAINFAPRAPEPIAVQLPAGGSIRGRLRGVDGGELPELWMAAHPASGDANLGTTPVRLVNGDFLLSGVASGSHTLSLIAHHGVAFRVPGPTVKVEVGQETRVDVSPAAFGLFTVRGSVEVDGEPQPLRSVHLQHLQGGAGLDCVADAHGGFCFAGIPGGSCRLSLRGVQRTPPRSEIAVVEVPLAQPACIDLCERTKIRLERCGPAATMPATADAEHEGSSRQALILDASARRQGREP